VAESDTRDKRERIAELDAIALDPGERAAKVWEILRRAAPHLTDWDVVCFAANYLGMQSTNFLWLEGPAKEVCKLVYTAHYLVTERTDVSSGLGSPTTLIDTEKRNTSGKRKSDGAGFDVEGGGFG
jgi:hypothetical protein